MGCDIHMFAEYLIDGKWHADEVHKATKEDGWHYLNTLPHRGRNYVLFGAIAGVRSNEIPPLYAPRGVPDDLSETISTAVELWGRDAHSHTYMSLEEYIDLIDYYNTMNHSLSLDYPKLGPGNSFYDIIEYCKDAIERKNADAILLNEPSLAINECRMIVFFDN
jgi:hypothetical protein